MEDNVNLHKIKTLNGGGIEATYKDLVREGNTEHINEHSIKSPVDPSPDLTDQLDELKTIVARCYGINGIDYLRTSPNLDGVETEAFQEVASLIDKMVLENMKKITVTGVSITGEKREGADNRAIVITAKMHQANGGQIAMNSPRIKLNQERFGFEDQLTTIIEKLEEEVKQYLFEGKKAQLDLFDEQEAPAMSVAN
jgi:hypothetical protein